MSLTEVVLLLIVASGSGAWWLTGRVLRYAQGRLLDIPNDRSSHTRAMPRGGGLAIVVAWVAAMIALDGIVGSSVAAKWAMGAALPIAVIGFWDDHGHISARNRMTVHVLAAAWSVYWLGGLNRLSIGGTSWELSWFGSMAAAFGLVWMLNLFNFMDGIDGIAASEAVFVSGAAALLSWIYHPELLLAPQLAVFAAACLGFLVWNWPPAGIFMGDVGSGFIGFVLGVFALESIIMGGLSLAVWLLLLAIFLVDATVTLVHRLVTGQRWLEAHRSHAYQHAALRWDGHRPVTLAVCVINLVWLLPLAFAVARWPESETALLALGYAPLLVGAWRLGAGSAQWSSSNRGLDS